MTEKEFSIICSVKKIVKEKELKYYQVAELMEISNKKLSDIMTGRKKITVDIIIMFCESLNISPNDLMGYENQT